MAQDDPRLQSSPNRTGNVQHHSSWSPDSEDEENNYLINTATSTNNRGNIQETPPEIQNVYNFSQAPEDKMRRRLRFFFMNPIEKWEAKQRFPYKFVIQIIKIVLVTLQLWLFAHNNYMHVNYTWDNRIAFSHLFLRGWDATQEVPAYPPATGPFALYKQSEFYETIDFAVENYYNMTDAIGSYSYPFENNSGIMELCLYHYKEGIVFGFNESYIFDPEIEKKCITIDEEKSKKLIAKTFLDSNNLKVNFSSLTKAELKFKIKTVNLKAAGRITPPDCYQFDIKIFFDNRDLDGQMLLSLDADPQRLECRGDTQYITDNQIDSLLGSLLNCLVIVICSISLILCSRAIYRAQLLKNETIKFFRTTYGKILSFEEKFEFINLWYVMIIVNDVLIICGTAIKEQIEKELYSSDHWNVCSIFLGTGNLLVWFGVLRYLGFFKTYNVVILTLKSAAPKVVRFLICAILIYAGFTFCGWLVLGPYHMKFRSLSTTSECLFALINGDDMFATFTITAFKSPLLWWYSRIYLYSFISLYIYVVLSLFIAVILDAYDTIKMYYKHGFPKNDLQTFISGCTDTASSGAFRDEYDNENYSDFLEKLCFWRRKKLFSSLQSSASSSATDPEPNNQNRI